MAGFTALFPPLILSLGSVLLLFKVDLGASKKLFFSLYPIFSSLTVWNTPIQVKQPSGNILIISPTIKLADPMAKVIR
jgi:hypothetical protein